ncbi:MAG: pilus assembly protein N-terminal domain-containing protein [Marinobacter sp.]|uniref:type II and III secretion system protein family protein n=1 Tax=Marinobacter sp. TaxID=50741 RepID=UPI00299EBE8C|nr:pilus assembly protein N-terminal domain-containing protein [Marinobacter sp.]MDX1635438.1 pilus assembly protein N-terminal domain-containing protein [Marinobacter sp.]
MYVKPFAVCFALLLAAALVPVPAEADSLLDGEPLTLGNGEQRTLSFPKSLSKVAISDPAVAGVSVSDKRELLLTAKAEGTAVLSVWLAGETDPLRAPVAVARTLGERLPFGTQVQTDIRIVEVNRNQLNELGTYYAKLFDGGRSAAGFAPPATGFQPFPGPGSVPGAISSQGFNLFRFGESSLAIINALESGGFAYTLAEPSLVSLSGQSATFLSGGEFPIPVRSDEEGIEVEFKEFGISLSLTPTVMNENQIILKVAPEVSDLDFSAGVSTAGVSVPGLRVRRTETTVAMASGETFIISGLVSRNTFNNSDRLPGLGNIPILGALFRSDRVSSEDRELIMVVTPRLVTPSGQKNTRLHTIARDYQGSSTDWLDMAIGSDAGSRPIKHGFSW